MTGQYIVILWGNIEKVHARIWGAQLQWSLLCENCFRLQGVTIMLQHCTLGFQQPGSLEKGKSSLQNCYRQL